MPTPLTDADKVIRNDTGISIANSLTALAGVVRGGNENIGDAYNPNNSYAAGDYCIYENTLYKCTGATSGAWDSTKWTAVTIADEIGRIDTALSGKADKAVITNISTISDTVSSSTDTDVYSVSLNKGVYIFNGSTLWKASGTAQGLTMISILGTDTLTQNLEYTVGWCVENLTCTFAVTTDNTTFKIRLYQTTGSNVEVDFSGNLTKIS